MKKQSTKQTTVSRIINAPVEMAWKTWTDPELVKHWWGPDRFTCSVAIIDFREGGVSLVSMEAPVELGRRIFYTTWLYQKIIPLKSIEFIQNLSDKYGNKVDPVDVGMHARFPTDIHTVVTFKPLADEKTRVSIVEFADMGPSALFAKIGLEQSMNKMARIFK